jgi:RecA-family ATPase
MVSAIRVMAEPADAPSVGEIDALARQSLSTIRPTAGSIRANIVRMDTIEPRSVNWLWQGRIAAGRISNIVGIPGGGKSYFTCDMAARISTGTNWPDGSPCPLGSVLFITAEDDPGDTIRPRLDACGADVSKIHLLSGLLIAKDPGEDEEVMFTLSDWRILEEAASAIPDLKAIVIDPIGSFLGGKTDAHRDNEVRGLLAPLAKVAERTGAAVIAIMHTRKSAGVSADDSALGSRAFTGLARSVWHLMRDPENPKRRLFLAGKNNLAPECDGLAFTISGCPTRVQWEDEAVVMSADEALAATHASQQQNSGAKATNAAEEWLIERLSRGDEDNNSVKQDAEKAGHKTRTIERAAQRINVRKYRPENPGPIWWSIRDGASVRQEPDNSPTQSVGELAQIGELTSESGNPLNETIGL